jgi:hypothetical protein
MKTSHRSVLLALVLVAAGGFGAGCAGPVATGVHRPFVGADYHQVYLTGSHIPVLVPKSPTARMVPTISPLSILTPEEIVRASVPTPFPMH